MHAPLRIHAVVLPGNRIEVSSPELHEGDQVEVTVVPANGAEKDFNILEFLDSLPPSKRTLAQWEQYDAEFQRERDAWDR